MTLSKSSLLPTRYSITVSRSSFKNCNIRHVLRVLTAADLCPPQNRRNITGVLVFIQSSKLHLASGKSNGKQTGAQNRMTKRNFLNLSGLVCGTVLLVGQLVLAQDGKPDQRAGARDIRRDRRDLKQDRKDIKNDKRDIMTDARDVRTDKKDVRQDIKNGQYKEARHDLRDLQQDSRDLKKDRRDLKSDKRDVRADRRDLRHDRKDLRRDRRK